MTNMDSSINLVKRLLISLYIINVENELNEADPYYLDINNMNIILGFSNQSDNIEEIQQSGGVDWKQVLYATVILSSVAQGEGVAFLPAAAATKAAIMSAAGALYAAYRVWDRASKVIVGYGKVVAAEEEAVKIMNRAADPEQFFKVFKDSFEVVAAEKFNVWNDRLGCNQQTGKAAGSSGCDVVAALVTATFPQDKSLAIIQRAFGEAGNKFPDAQKQYLSQGNQIIDANTISESNEIISREEFDGLQNNTISESNEIISREEFDGLQNNKGITISPKSQSIINVLDTFKKGFSGEMGAAISKFTPDDRTISDMSDFMKQMNEDVNIKLSNKGIKNCSKYSCDHKESTLYEMWKSVHEAQFVAQTYALAASTTVGSVGSDLIKLWMLDILMDTLTLRENLIMNNDIDPEKVATLLALPDSNSMSKEGAMNMISGMTAIVQEPIRSFYNLMVDGALITDAARYIPERAQSSLKDISNRYSEQRTRRISDAFRDVNVGRDKIMQMLNQVRGDMGNAGTVVLAIASWIGRMPSNPVDETNELKRLMEARIE